jgi:hypothetical protein
LKVMTVNLSGSGLCPRGKQPMGRDEALSAMPYGRS